MSLPEKPYQDLLFFLAAKHRHKQIRRAGSTRRDKQIPYDLRFSKSQKTGLVYENHALDYLQKKGLLLLKRNLKSIHGEVDLVMQDRQTLVWIEVRYRRTQQFGDAAASISKQKQHRIRKTAAYFLPMVSHDFFAGKIPACRFDVVTIDGLENEIKWLQNAFI